MAEIEIDRALDAVGDAVLQLEARRSDGQQHYR
jgi:hypothetical protein